MKIYTCLRCKKSFNNKAHLRNHFKKKKLCNAIFKNYSYEELLIKLEDGDYIDFYNNSVKNEKLECKFCNKCFSSKFSLNRHLHNCNEKEKSLLVHKQNVTNIQNQQNNFYININSVGNECFNIKEITDQLNFVLGYGNFNGNQLQYKDRINNMIDNYGIIFDNIYKNPTNHNFNIINKKKNICKIKDENDNLKHIKFDELTNKIFDIISNIFDLSIIEFELNNDNKSLLHYKEFKKNLIQRKDKFITQYYNTTDAMEKKNIYDSLYQYFKGFKDIVSNIKDKIVLKSYDIDL
jgi:hypothetical protein